jgi:hypothetical protein
MGTYSFQISLLSLSADYGATFSMLDKATSKNGQGKIVEK